MMGFTAAGARAMAAPMRFPACCGGPLTREFVRQVLPGFLRQFVEELMTLLGLRLVDDGAQVLDGPGVEQDIRMIVGKVAD